MFSRGVQYMLISTLAFSLMTVCVKYLKHIPFFELILFRSLVSLVLSLVYIKAKDLNPLGNNRPLLIKRGVVGTIALSLFFLSIQNLPLASAATIGYLSPIFTAIFAVFILNERIIPKQWLFFAISFSGIVLIKGFDGNVSWFYILTGVVAAMLAGFAYNFVRKLRTTDNPIVVVFYFPLVATPVMLVWSIFNWVQPVGIDWLVLIAMGILTQFGQVYLSKALYLENAGRMTSIKYLGTVNALLFSVFFFHEYYSLINLLGILLVIMGVLLNIYYTSDKKMKQQSLKG
ncbi:MAG: DMT family transporter [Chitinophagales bacterium]